jgi:prepilin signal peptidase PulO-like enzyme (type II secretory pathway)
MPAAFPAAVFSCHINTMLNHLTPWEVATNVPQAATPGLLPRTITFALTMLAAVVIALILWPVFGPASLAMGLLFGRLIALDLTTYTLPNVYTIPLATVGLFHALSAEHLGQAFLAIIILFCFNKVMAHANLRMARHVGFGGGDFKLLAALFAFLPLTSAFWAIAVGCLAYMPAAFAKPKATVPFGVPLIIGWVILLRVPHLPNWLISTIS